MLWSVIGCCSCRAQGPSPPLPGRLVAWIGERASAHSRSYTSETKTISRQDSGKFLYILNQIDTTAREDNPEEVVGAWQRALAREGLTSGRFYCVYDPEASVPIQRLPATSCPRDMGTETLRPCSSP